VWIYTANKLAKFHGKILSLSENIAKSFRGATFFDSHCRDKNTLSLKIVNKQYKYKCNDQLIELIAVFVQHSYEKVSVPYCMVC